MPYIKGKDRTAICIGTKGCQTAGELNYAITILCKAYLRENGLSYQRINDIVGALEGCKLEFYRRLVAGYEDKKIQENGDVY